MTIGFDLGHDLDLEFSRSNMDFAISQSKMVRLPQNKKQTYRLISRPQMWPSGLTLDMTLTLNFQGQIWNWLYLCQKWSDCHKTKSKHIDWTLGLKCDHQIWPWPWIFKAKYEFLYISTKTGPIATKRKANILIWALGLKYDQWVWPWPWPWINIWILKVICDLGHLVTKVRCKDLPDNDWGDFRCRCAVDSSSLLRWWRWYIVECAFELNVLPYSCMCDECLGISFLFVYITTTGSQLFLSPHMEMMDL